MSEASGKLVGEMNEVEFNALIERFIERETEGTDEVPAEVLFEALPDFLAVRNKFRYSGLATGHFLSDAKVSNHE